jgi:hypothetical protein
MGRRRREMARSAVASPSDSCSFVPIRGRAARIEFRCDAQKMIDAKFLQLYIRRSRKEVSHYGKEESR